MEKENYQKEYQQFLDDYKAGITSAEQVGVLLVRLSNYFSGYNMMGAETERALNKKAVEIVNSTDSESGKAISVAKADKLIDATDEHYSADLIKRHLTNIDGYLNSLKKLQGGIANEYNHMGNS